MQPGERPSLDQVRAWLSQVPDPEIPIISVVDLGIIRDLAWDGETLVVAVTPTYSGCPATSIINLDIEQVLRAHGIEKVRLERRLSPPWTTDWISTEAREKLRDYGIAPPVGGSAALARLSGLPVTCPRCGSAATERISQFGSTPCKATYRCKDCLEPFDYFKCI
jgi:ring-1,2-phenylacetyl-CoA epoxidase subunit PaaD